MTATAEILNHPHLEEANLASLRNLLLVHERAQIKKILHRLDDPATRAAEIAKILPQALTLHAADSNDPAAALTPLIRDALAEALREQPDLLISALRSALAQTFLTPWRFLSFLLPAPLRHNIQPAHLSRLYLLDRRTGNILQQIIHSPTEPAKTTPPDSLDADIDAMITTLLDLLRNPDQLARYAALGQIRVEHHTYALFAGPTKVLLSLHHHRAGLDRQLHACQQILFNAELGHPLPEILPT